MAVCPGMKGRETLPAKIKVRYHTTASQLDIILNMQPQRTKQRGRVALSGGRRTQEPGVRGGGARDEPLLPMMLLLIHPMACFNLPF